MNNEKDETQATDAPVVKPLPAGYLWRVGVMITLLLSACVCFLFINSIIGWVLMACSLAFGKFSSLHDLEKEVIASNDTKSVPEPLPNDTQQ